MPDFADRSAKLEDIIYISNQMVMMRELAPLLSFALGEVVQLLGAEQGFIVLADDDNPDSYQINSFNDEPTDNLLRSSISSSILSKVITSNESLVVTNALSDDDFAKAASVMHLQLRSVICAPLRHKSTNIGAIYLENKTIADRFGQDDLPLLEIFANQAAIAIANARLNDSLNLANSKLAKMNEQKSQLIQVIAHELKTPATNISLFIDLYRRNPNAKYLDRLQTVSDEIISKVNELVLISALVSDQLSLNLSTIELESLFNRLNEEFEEPLRERNILYRVQQNGSWPTWVGDDEKMFLAMLHLLSNAIKFTPDGGEVTVNIVVSGKNLEIQVYDSGIGIPEDELEQIFELFYILGDREYHSSSRFAYLGSGLGIGLTLARGIVEAHGGRIEMKSSGYDVEKFLGSTCLIYLPLEQTYS